MFWGNLARAAETAFFSGLADSSAVVTLLGNVPKFSRLGASLALGDTTLYCMVEEGTDNWQGGIGTYSSADSITLTSCLQSSNANAPVTFGSGAKVLFSVAADVAEVIRYAPAKTTPVDADEFGLVDSAASYSVARLTWSDVKAGLKSYLDSATSTLTNKTLTNPVINGFTGDTAIINIGSGQFYKDATGNISMSGRLLVGGPTDDSVSTLQIAGNGTFTGTVTATTFIGALTGTASNASALLGATWASPAAIGSTAPAAGTFTTLHANSDLTVDGNLIVSGSTTQVSTTNLTVTDPLVKYASANTTDAVDTGFYSLYQPAATPLYTGLFRDASDGKYKLFAGLQSEPTTTVDTVGAGYTVATLVAILEGNASSATVLATARAINGVSFNGSADITVTAAANTLSGTTLASGVVNASLNAITPTGGTLSVSGSVQASTAAGTGSFGLGRRDTGAIAWTTYSTAGNWHLYSNALTQDVMVYTPGTGLVVTGNVSTGQILSTTLGANNVFAGPVLIKPSSSAYRFTFGELTGSHRAGFSGDAALVWGPGGDALGMIPDIGLSRVSAGLLGVGNGITIGDFSGDLKLHNLIATNTVTAASFSGPLTGNASSATVLATPRAINGVNFDGSAAITVTADASTLSGTTLAAGVVNASLNAVTPTGGTFALTGALSAIGSANTLAVAGSSTGNPVTLTATGSDTNIDVNVVTKGTGGLKVNGGLISAPAGSSGQVQYNNAATLAGVNLWVEDANTLAQRNGLTAQALRVYNTYTDASNYERGVFGWQSTANTLSFGVQVLGTGTLRSVAFLGASFLFNTGSTPVTQFLVAHTASAVNYLQVTGATASSSPTLSAQGSDTNLDLNLVTKGSGLLRINGSPLRSRQWVPKSAAYTAVSGDRLQVNTSGGAVTITLPASPGSGDFVEFSDGGGAFATNNLTVARNGQTIMGLAEDMTVSVNNQSFGIAFNGTTWRTY